MRKQFSLVRVQMLLLCGILAATYFGLCVFLRFWQTRLIFFPSEAIATTPVDFGLSYQEVWIPVGKEQIHGWWIGEKHSPVLLYLHGNGSNIGDLVGRAERFHQLGLSVMLIDYRGYGRSQGAFPTEASVYADAEAAWNYLRQRQITPQNIVLYGHSLGGAIAIELAVRHPDLGGVIVEGTFTSIRAMVDKIGQYQLFPVDWILTQRFDSLAKVSLLKTPILFVHGTADLTVPPQMSQDLFAAAPEPKQLLLIPNAGHNNIVGIGGNQYLQAIRKFINQAR